MAITTDEKYILDNLAGPVAGKVKLGTLIKNAESTYAPVYAGKFTTAGGAATEDHTVTGALTTDIAIVTLNTAGVTPVTIKSSKVSAASTLEVVFSADPSTDHVVNYVILRAST